MPGPWETSSVRPGTEYALLCADDSRPPGPPQFADDLLTGRVRVLLSAQESCTTVPKTPQPIVRFAKRKCGTATSRNAPSAIRATAKIASAMRGLARCATNAEKWYARRYSASLVPRISVKRVQVLMCALLIRAAGIADHPSKAV